MLPAWRHKGIGTAMLWWAQERIRAIAAEERDGGPAFLATNVSTTEREARLGFREVKQHLLYRKPLHVHPQS